MHEAQARCEYLVARSRWPGRDAAVADLPCGNRASFTGPDQESLCGKHVRVLLRRRALAGHSGAWDLEWSRRLAAAGTT